MTFDQFAEELSLSRDTLVFKQLEYMGCGDAQAGESASGLATLFTRAETLTLRDAAVDLAHEPLDSESQLRNLQLEYSTFKPPNQLKGH